MYVYIYIYVYVYMYKVYKYIASWRGGDGGVGHRRRHGAAGPIAGLRRRRPKPQALSP